MDLDALGQGQGQPLATTKGPLPPKAKNVYRIIAHLNKEIVYDKMFEASSYDTVGGFVNLYHNDKFLVKSVRLPLSYIVDVNYVKISERKGEIIPV